MTRKNLRNLYAPLVRVLALVALFALPTLAQNSSVQDRDTTPRQPRVIVTGDAVVQAQPDTAILSVSVVTQNKSALEAQQENARRSERVLSAVREAAGAGAEVKTSGYVLTPQRVYRENQPPAITGYEARNSVTVTLGDLSRVGRVIDAATQAGANNVENVSFTLRKDRPAQEQALREATAEALSKAQAVAQSLGGRVLRVVEVREAGAIPPRPLYETAGFARAQVAPVAQTPIEIGAIDVRSEVQLTVEIETRK